ncbi:MAG TPA: AmmeMemoRadiSam system protein B [Kiritimatiellia bacterium]|nr:AmmeMemoRadiSam system protein B [Kiritimatiellia bacterium]HMP32847.1 AmmeMemoRadiSam system protein B [Kiritimatiellia bacterium]
MTAETIRPPAVAGMFYPAHPRELRHEIASYLADVRGFTGSPPKALIAPHAGYIYSGPIAGSAYATLSGSRSGIRRVVIASPSHRVGFRGMATSSATAFRTPLGDVSVDSEASAALLACPGVHVLDRAHRDEHGIEVHLPFLQHVLADFRIAPIVVGDTDDATMAAALAAVWGGDETLVVISSDLSHYLPYARAQAIDNATSRAIVALDPEAIAPDQACGQRAIRGLLCLARDLHLTATTLDLRNSGDTAGDRSSVVGYGAYAFTT